MNLELLSILKESVQENNGCVSWNTWREKNPSEEIDFSGVELCSQNLSKANLSYIKFTNANLSGSNLYDAYLAYSDFFSADLSDANLKDVNFYKAHLHSADLSDSDLTYAELIQVNAAKANFSGAKFDSANCHLSNFTLADLSYSILKKSDFSKAIFVKTNLTEAYLEEVILNDAAIITSNWQNSEIKSITCNRLILALSSDFTWHDDLTFNSEEELQELLSYLRENKSLKDLLKERDDWEDDW